MLARIFVAHQVAYYQVAEYFQLSRYAAVVSFVWKLCVYICSAPACSMEWLTDILISGTCWYNTTRVL